MTPGTADRPLAGRTAIITGAGQGLGAEIARRYAEAGASVLICARSHADVTNVARELQSSCVAGQQVVARAADVATPHDVDDLVAMAVDAFGRIDVLVNNAGVYGPLGSLEDVDWQAWVDALAINLLGTVYACRAVLPAMKRQRSGKIVNLSGGGATAPLPRMSSYAAAKAAVVRFTESLAVDVRQHGIDVNSIAPGLLATRLLDEVLEAGPKSVGTEFHERMKKAKLEGGTPLTRAAELAVWLGSAASDGITGRLISAAWDPWPQLHRHREELDPSDIYTLRRITPQDRGLNWGEA